MQNLKYCLILYRSLPIPSLKQMIHIHHGSAEGSGHSGLFSTFRLMEKPYLKCCRLLCHKEKNSRVPGIVKYYTQVNLCHVCLLLIGQEESHDPHQMERCYSNQMPGRKPAEPEIFSKHTYLSCCHLLRHPNSIPMVF